MADDEQASGWQLTESDPGVFTELLRLLGTPLVMDELYTLDYSTLSSDPLGIISPIQALIFLFKWTADREGGDVGEGGSRGPKTGGVYDPAFAERGGFYAKQVVNNACATLAIVNALGNIPELKVGDVLGNIFSFGVGMDAWTLGEVLTSSSDLRTIHNSLSPPSAISLDGLNLPKGESEDAYHFIVYTPVGGSLVELDGLKRDAVNHGAIDDGNSWLEKALGVIQRRIEMYPAGAVEFNLQALRPDPIPLLTSGTSSPHLTTSEVQDILHAEQAKRQRWAFENAVRRHNHLGLAVGLLQALAKASVAGTGAAGGEGLWEKTMERAKEDMKKRVAKRREMLALAGKGGQIPEGMDFDD
ncbi:hypothetical protein M408DRAFT_330054 [Serendipita vermifera MAFF 305830]|uniref:ubiquitinyl hydrolase 1 n=1 Tax=Serendipita vermifera MAFF 305830 TaxID=933852 RepID=A0A0C3B767_SERVB|nr:hypothetical protein M408DRAFT_330054 [Serendipita vermifera MAFF 305830]